MVSVPNSLLFIGTNGVGVKTIQEALVLIEALGDVCGVCGPHPAVSSLKVPGICCAGVFGAEIPGLVLSSHIAYQNNGAPCRKSSR